MAVETFQDMRENESEPLESAPEKKARVAHNFKKRMGKADVYGLNPDLDRVLEQIEAKKAEAIQISKKDRTKADREYQELCLQKTLLLRELWHRVKYLISGSLGAGVENNADINLISRLPQIEEAIMEGPVRATDVVGSRYFPEERTDTPDFLDSHDQRRFVPEKEIVRFGSYMAGEIEKVLPDGVAPEMSQCLEKLLLVFLQKIKGKIIFTRPDLPGILDLVDDPMIIEEVANDENLIAERLAGWIKQGDMKRGGSPEAARLEIYKDIFRLVDALNTVCSQRELTKLDLTKQKIEELPLELQVIIDERPDLALLIKRLAKLQKETGIDLRLQTKSRTEGKVLAAINRISIYSQENFLLSWLPQLIKDGRRPKVQISEGTRQQKEELEDALATAEAELEELENSFIVEMERIKSGSASKKEFVGVELSTDQMIADLAHRTEPRHQALSKKCERIRENLEEYGLLDLEKDVDTVLEGSIGYKQVLVVGGEHLPVSKQQEICRLVESLNEGLGNINKEYALRRMVFDNASERTSEAQEIVKKMMFIGPIAHGLEGLELGVAAKLFASSADDLMGEWAEIKALLGSGFSVRSVLQRMKLAMPVFAGATYGASQVEKLLEGGRDLEAGALFGLTAVALSLTTSIQSMGMYHECYEILTREGKISDKVAVLQAQPEFQVLMEQFGEEMKKMTPEMMLRKIEEIMETIPQEILSEVDKEKILAQLGATLPQDGIKGFLQRRQFKNALTAWKKAIEQDFKNPVRAGILIGSLLAPVCGMVAASHGLMHHGLVLAGIGSVESITAGAIVKLAQTKNEFDYKRGLQTRLRKPLAKK